MANAFVDGTCETRVLLNAPKGGYLSIDKLSPEGASVLAEHLRSVSIERALVERHALLLLQRFNIIGVLDELIDEEKWAKAIAAGEAPEFIERRDWEQRIAAIPEESWKAEYGYRARITRAHTEATLHLASSVLTARTARSLSDTEVVLMLLEAIEIWNAMRSNAWAHLELELCDKEETVLRDCGQRGVCRTPPGCARHWEERTRELVRENEVLRANINHLSAENASLVSHVESMAMRIESLAGELAKPEDVRLREVLDALDGRAVSFDRLGARVRHLLDEMDEWIERAGEAERRLAEYDAR